MIELVADIGGTRIKLGVVSERNPPCAMRASNYDKFPIIDVPDLARWEAQQRQPRHEISNLGADSRELKPSLQYKRSFFIDWRVCDRLKSNTMDRWDYLLDTAFRASRSCALPGEPMAARFGAEFPIQEPAISMCQRRSNSGSARRVVHEAADR